MNDSSVVRTCLRRWLAGTLLCSAFVASMPGSSRAATADDVITVGVVLPITGKEGKPGQYQKEGIELAFKQINDAGGIFVKEKGKKLLIKEVFYDDGSDSAKSASLTERAMSSDNVTAVLGGYSTALGEAESVMPDRYQTPWITTGAGATAIFGRGYQYAFGSLSPVVLIGTTSAQFLGGLIDQGKLKRACDHFNVKTKTVHGKLVVDSDSIMGFLYLLDRRLYQVELVKDSPESFLAASRSRIK